MKNIENNTKSKKIKPLSLRQKMTIQLILGVFLALMGCVLLWVGLFLPPVGIIDPSVLTALGEVFTFSGALIGVDYSYKYKTLRFLHHHNEELEEEQEDEEER